MLLKKYQQNYSLLVSFGKALVKNPFSISFSKQAKEFTTFSYSKLINTSHIKSILISSAKLAIMNRLREKAI